MSKENFVMQNFIRRFRDERGWSQQELAERAGLSRTGVSAIESGRLIPSTAAALALASIFGCRVEDLFVRGGAENAQWAWPPPQEPCRYWRALVGGRTLLYPVESSTLGTLPHDGIWRAGQFHDHPFAEPERTLVIAGCDPAAALLAGEYARQTGFRLLILHRSSCQAVHLLEDGLVHAAGVHLAEASDLEGNRSAAAQIFHQPFRLLRLADWQEGLALAPGLDISTVRAALDASLNWIGREPGSGARQVLDEIFEGRMAPAHTASDHRGIAVAIRSGFAQAGISVQLVCEEEGLRFVSVREGAYDLVIPQAFAGDPRLRALENVVRSTAYRRLISELPGYGTSLTGEVLTGT
jgi:molybdate-binding protein/DNA-binding XRE family transcriptional regulator